jgi:signal recognition particle subunit SRP54
MIPGMSGVKLDETADEKSLVVVESIIQSMTPAERKSPQILNGSRKRRIAAGCGRTVPDVNRLLKQFEEMKKMMKMFTGNMRGMKGKFKMPFV